MAVVAAYGYSPATGRLETVSGASAGTFTCGHEPNNDLVGTITRPGLHAGQPALRVTNTWDATRYVLLTKANETVMGNVATTLSTTNYTANTLNQHTVANGEALPADSYDADGNQIHARIRPPGASSLALILGTPKPVSPPSPSTTCPARGTRWRC